jgi:hypothetical protein
MSSDKKSVFDLKNLNPGFKFEMDGGGTIWLRVCSADALKQIQKQTTTQKIEYKRVDGKPQRIVSTITDDEASSEMIWDYCIVKWENFFDAEGNAIPCTKEMKMLLMGNSPKFSNFIINAIREIQPITEEVIADIEKN